jgi:acetyltransferase-like isoleucine patch superfamily enzyme
MRFWCEIAGGTIQVDDGAEIGRHSVVDFSGGLQIGKNALISEGVLIYTHDHGYDPRSEPTATSLSIGENAWIGARAVILPSVSMIGDHAIIGAGAVVSQDVPAGHVCVAAKSRVFPRKDLHACTVSSLPQSTDTPKAAEI